MLPIVASLPSPRSRAARAPWRSPSLAWKGSPAYSWERTSLRYPRCVRVSYTPYILNSCMLPTILAYLFRARWLLYIRSPRYRSLRRTAVCHMRCACSSIDNDNNDDGNGIHGPGNEPPVVVTEAFLSLSLFLQHGTPQAPPLSMPHGTGLPTLTTHNRGAVRSLSLSLSRMPPRCVLQHRPTRAGGP